MKKITLLALVLGAMGGCYYTEGGEAPCWGLLRTEQRCVYQSPAVDGVTGFECKNLKRITYDGKTMHANKVIFDCREDETQSTITILQQDDDCGDHEVGGCAQ